MVVAALRLLREKLRPFLYKISSFERVTYKRVVSTVAKSLTEICRRIMTNIFIAKRIEKIVEI
jgi:hypothetical protein